MKAMARLYFGSNKTPRRKLKLNGSRSVPESLQALAVLLADEKEATRVEIVITVPRRRSS